MEQQRCNSQKYKKFIFLILATMQNNMFKHEMILITVSLAQLLTSHYYYINPNHDQLSRFQAFQWYFDNVFKQYFLIYVSKEQPLFINAIFLSILPILVIFLIGLNFIQMNMYCLLFIEILLLITPLFMIRLVLETIQIFNCSTVQWIYFAPILSVISLFMLFITLILYNKKIRILQIPLILMIEFKFNSIAIYCYMFIRIIILFYLSFSKNNIPNRIKTFYETTLFVVLLTSLLVSDYILNYIAFLVLVLSFIAIPFLNFYKSSLTNTKIFQLIEISSIDVQAETKINKYLESHIINCQKIDCFCKDIPAFSNTNQYQQWTFKFQIQISNSESFQEKILFIQNCFNQSQFTFKGLVALTNLKSTSIYQNYTIFRLAQMYQLSLRSFAKNNQSKQFFLPCEQVDNFQVKVNQLINQVSNFWQNLLYFDGSSKFIDLITLISKQVFSIQQLYMKSAQKFDQHSEFTYTYEIFKSILLQKKKIEQIQVPQETLYFTSSKGIINNINRPLLKFFSIQKDQIIGHSYKQFIPHIYRDFHQIWANQFIQNYRKETDKFKQKAILKKQGIIQIALMQNIIVPRFAQGIQIVTYIKKKKRNMKNSYIFKQSNLLIDIQTLKIKYFDISFLKSLFIEDTKQNIEIITEMKINDFFPKITTLKLIDKNPPKDIFINSKLFQNSEQFYNIQLSDQFQQYLLKKKRDKKFNFQVSQSCPEERLKQYRIVKIIQSSNQFDDLSQFQSDLQDNKFKDQYEKYKKLQLEKNIKLQDKNNGKESQQKFNLPYYLFLFSVIFHSLFFLLMIQYSQMQINFKKLNEFWQSSISQCLYFQKIPFAKQSLEITKDLWMKGFGLFPESFYAFDHSQQFQSINFINEKVCYQSHNILSDYINIKLVEQNQKFNNYYNYLVICLILFIFFTLLDTGFNLRYMKNVEIKVEQIILIFLKLNQEEIKQTLQEIKKSQRKFFGNIKKSKEDNSLLSFLSFQSPSQTHIKNTSFNFNPCNSISHRNAINQFGKCEKAQSGVSSLKQNKPKLSSNFKKIVGQNSNLSSVAGQNCMQKIDKYQQKKSFVSLVKRTFSSWIIVLMGSLLIFVSILFIVIFILVFLPNLKLNTNIAFKIQQKPIILFKEIEQKNINKRLNPQISINILNSQVYDEIKSVTFLMQQFKTFYDTLENKQNCQFIQNRTLFQKCETIQNGLFRLGQKIVLQYLSQKIRNLKNNSQIFTKSFSDLITIELELMQLSKSKIQFQMKNFQGKVWTWELICLIINLGFLFIGLILMRIGLSFYRKKIINSENLLKIIPQRIANKKQETIILENQLSIYPVGNQMSIQI